MAVNENSNYYRLPRMKLLILKVHFNKSANIERRMH